VPLPEIPPEPVSEINVAQPPVSEGCATVSGTGHLLGCARVSTTDQRPQLQVDPLEHAGCYRVFTETASGARPDRPTLEQLLDQLRPGDTRSSGSSTASAAPCGTWSTPSPARSSARG
jgi:predicted site-specific integrase-resolvase